MQESINFLISINYLSPKSNKEFHKYEYITNKGSLTNAINNTLNSMYDEIACDIERRNSIFNQLSDFEDFIKNNKEWTLR